MDTKQTFPKVHTDKDNFFTFIEVEENQIIICVGNERVSQQTFKTLEKAKEYTKRKPWELLVNVMCVVTNKIIQYEKSQSNS